MTDFYHDDPIEELGSERKKPKVLFGSVLLLFAGGLFLNTTLAANISLNSGGRVEFGQGMTLTAACAGSTALTVTPNSSFVNAAGAGAHFFNSVRVSGIPSSCNGVDFTLSVYDSTTSSALPLFNTSKTVVRIWNDAGTFKVGSGSSGATIESGSGAFTVSFNSPAARATNVSKLTIQSSDHVALVCAVDGVGCSVGDLGPGGGRVFYVNNSGFSAPGTACGNNCTGLEYARTWSWNNGQGTWDLPDGFAAGWGAHTGTYIRTNRVADYLTNGTGDQAIGAGFMNTSEMILREPTQTKLAKVVRAYAGANNTDGQWFIPSLWELRELYLATAARSGGAFEADEYASSSERDNTFFWQLNLGTGNISIEARGNNSRVRPIRAF